MKAATDRMQREMDLAAAEKRQRWDRAAEAKKKMANVRTSENVSFARKNVTQKAVAAKSRQEGSFVVTGNSVAPAPEVAAGATLVDVRSAQVTGDVRCQRSTSGAGAHPEEEDEVAVLAPGLGSDRSAVVADAVVVADSAKANDYDMEKTEEMIERLKVKNLALHGATDCGEDGSCASTAGQPTSTARHEESV